ncbi:MAG: acyl-CoA dehydrogenase, partial [Actinobacteria bacterium]|nr:acyl-CoA dehydrogenase [Actinomycetota bacterium]
HPRPTGEQLARRGLVAPHWPRPWGLDASPIEQLLVDDELRRASVQRPTNPIGIGWAGPTIVMAGTQEQKDRYLFELLSGEHFWCQLFSEPESGSDLASLRTTAVRDGDEWVVNGQKIWTSAAQFAQYGILLARTDARADKHHGITYFICEMRAPGIEIRPIREMTGGATFNEVFFTNVRIPHDNVVGDVHDGWRLARVTLGNERVSLSTGGALWGRGPTAMDVVDAARAMRTRGVTLDADVRDQVTRLYLRHVLLELIRTRTLVQRLAGAEPGPEASVRKIMADEHGQDVMAVGQRLVGATAMLLGATNAELPREVALFASPEWAQGTLFSRALTIGGGTGEVQRNILAERVLGLPRDASPTTLSAHGNQAS